MEKKAISLKSLKSNARNLFMIVILTVSGSVSIDSSYASTSEYVACKVWNPDTNSYSLQGNFEIRDDVVVATSVGTLCKGLIEIPEGVTEIQNSVFYGSSEIKEVSLPSTMRNIGSYAFQYSTLETVTAKNGLQDIGISAFHGSQLKTFSSINSVKNIYAHAFYRTNLESFNFSNSIERIEDSAFQETKLQFVRLPTSLIHLGTYVFADVGSLTGFEFPSEITEIPEGLLALTSSLGTPVSPELISTIHIPDSVLYIGDYAFKNRNSITSIDLSYSLKQIGIQSLSGTSINELTLPRNLETISAEALMNSPLNSIKLNEGIKSIGVSAFRDTLISKAYIPKSVEFLDKDAFYNTPLRQVTIGKTANFNDSYAFTNLDLNYINASDFSVKYCPEAGSDSATMISTLENSTLGFYILNDLRDFSCSVPDSPMLLSAIANGSEGVRVKVMSPFSDGGEPISKLIFADENSNFLGEVSYAGTDIYSLSGFYPGQTLRLKVAAMNSIGLSQYSTLSSSVTISARNSEEEQKAQQREAERLRQIEITKSRETLLKNVTEGIDFTLTDLQKSDFNGANKDNFAKIQKEIDKRTADQAPSIELIQAAIKYVVVIEDVSRPDLSGKRMYANSLVEIGLISSSSKNKTQIFYLIKQASADFRKDEESLVLLISRIEMAIKARSERLAELRIRMEARRSAA